MCTGHCNNTFSICVLIWKMVIWIQKRFLQTVPKMFLISENLFSRGCKDLFLYFYRYVRYFGLPRLLFSPIGCSCLLNYCSIRPISLFSAGLKDNGWLLRSQPAVVHHEWLLDRKKIVGTVTPVSSRSNKRFICFKKRSRGQNAPLNQACWLLARLRLHSL